MATTVPPGGSGRQAPSWGDPLHLTIPHDRWIRAPRGVSLHRSRCLDVRSVTEVHGLRTTTVARTVVDVAAELTASQVEGLTLHARQRDLLTAQALREQHERRPRLAGAGKVRQALDVLDTDGSDSILEARARRLLVDAGLVPSSAPHPVACVGETLMVDIAFPGRRLAVECDGRAFHSSPSAFERDRRRWRMLREAGWTIIWATWDRIHSQPVQFVTEVRRALQG